MKDENENDGKVNGAGGISSEVICYRMGDISSCEVMEVSIPMVQITELTKLVDELKQRLEFMNDWHNDMEIICQERDKYRALANEAVGLMKGVYALLHSHGCSKYYDDFLSRPDVRELMEVER
jgi:hypothetical protein